MPPHRRHPQYGRDVKAARNRTANRFVSGFGICKFPLGLIDSLDILELRLQAFRAGISDRDLLINDLVTDLCPEFIDCVFIGAIARHIAFGLPDRADRLSEPGQTFGNRFAYRKLDN